MYKVINYTKQAIIVDVTGGKKKKVDPVKVDYKRIKSPAITAYLDYLLDEKKFLKTASREKKALMNRGALDFVVMNLMGDQDYIKMKKKHPTAKIYDAESGKLTKKKVQFTPDKKNPVSLPPPKRPNYWDSSSDSEDDKLPSQRSPKKSNSEPKKKPQTSSDEEEEEVSHSSDSDQPSRKQDSDSDSNEEATESESDEENENRVVKKSKDAKGQTESDSDSDSSAEESNESNESKKSKDAEPEPKKKNRNPVSASKKSESDESSDESEEKKKCDPISESESEVEQTKPQPKKTRDPVSESDSSDGSDESEDSDDPKQVSNSKDPKKDSKTVPKPTDDSDDTSDSTDSEEEPPKRVSTKPTEDSSESEKDEQPETSPVPNASVVSRGTDSDSGLEQAPSQCGLEKAPANQETITVVVPSTERNDRGDRGDRGEPSNDPPQDTLPKFDTPPLTQKPTSRLYHEPMPILPETRSYAEITDPTSSMSKSEVSATVMGHDEVRLESLPGSRMQSFSEEYTNTTNSTPKNTNKLSQNQLDTKNIHILSHFVYNLMLGQVTAPNTISRETACEIIMKMYLVKWNIRDVSCHKGVLPLSEEQIRNLAKLVGVQMEHVLLDETNRVVQAVFYKNPESLYIQGATSFREKIRRMIGDLDVSDEKPLKMTTTNLQLTWTNLDGVNIVLWSETVRDLATKEMADRIINKYQTMMSNLRARMGDEIASTVSFVIRDHLEHNSGSRDKISIAALTDIVERLYVGLGRCVIIDERHTVIIN